MASRKIKLKNTTFTDRAIVGSENEGVCAAMSPKCLLHFLVVLQNCFFGERKRVTSFFACYLAINLSFEAFPKDLVWLLYWSHLLMKCYDIAPPTNINYQLLTPAKLTPNDFDSHYRTPKLGRTQQFFRCVVSYSHCFLHTIYLSIYLPIYLVFTVWV